jgi:hypothetical protein
LRGCSTRLHCSECRALVGDFQDAWEADRNDTRVRFTQTAEAADRDPRTFLLHWVMSVAQMPDDEFEALQALRYPRVAEVRRRWNEHAARSGHATIGDGWRAGFIFNAVVRAGYGGFRPPQPRRAPNP